MNNQTNIEKLIMTGKTVFNANDLAIIWQISDRKKLNERIKYYLRSKRFINIYKGLYSYGNYTVFNIAQKLVPMSYISLYTSAQKHGIIFQYDPTVYCISLISKKYIIDNQKYEYHKVKDVIFYNNIGLIKENNYLIANKERTICDLLYIYPDFAFDNLKSVNIKLLRQISMIYNNKRLQKTIDQVIKITKE